MYIEILKDIYTDSSVTVHLHKESEKIRIKRGVKQIGSKKNTFQIELKNRFTALEEHEDMDSLNKNLTEMIQQVH